MKKWSDLKFWKHTYQAVLDRLDIEKTKGLRPLEQKYFPKRENWFRAFELTPFDKVKVVILGQDPYHTKGMADGLAFSVSAHIRRLPPSLRNIFKELQDDLGVSAPRTGDLRAWAERGVLLLNTILTVEEGKPLSHADIGWEKLAFESIRALSDSGTVVFLLMGKRAQQYKAACSPCPTVCVPHPSPLSKGFLGSKPFSKINEELKKLKQEPIDWRL